MPTDAPTGFKPVKIHWKVLRTGEYTNRNHRTQYIAEIFSSRRGWSWAWGVWHERGCESGIEVTFRAAKHRAEEVIEKVLESKR